MADRALCEKHIFIAGLGIWDSKPEQTFAAIQGTK